MKYWLMKSEPDAYSIEDLKKDKSTLWDGIRNYQARNFMINDMSPGDRVLFYHSNAKPPGVAGVAEIASTSVPDPSQFDKKSKYYDEKSTKEKPRWHCVKVKYKKTFSQFISLEQIKKDPHLKNMLLIKKGTRLSIQPITKDEFEHLYALGL